jgi:hypothetical protein
MRDMSQEQEQENEPRVICNMCGMRISLLDLVPHILVCHSAEEEIEAAAAAADETHDQDAWVTTTVMMFVLPVNDGEEEEDARSPLPPHDEVLSPVVPDETDNMCPVCLCPLSEAKDVVRIKNCGHVYCDACITKWLYEHSARECALCKQDVRGASRSKRARSEEEEEDEEDDGYSDWRPERRRVRVRIHDQESTTIE